MLTNPRAQRVKSVRALGRRSARERAGRFVAEGPQAVREALAFAPGTVVEVYAEPGVAERHADLLTAAAAADVPFHETSPEVLSAMAGTEHPQGLIAVCRPVDVPLAQALGPDPRLVVVLTNVRDPGNAGTVIRCADAVGADAVVVSAASVDIYNPKVVRSTAGSLWHLPLVRGVEIEQALEACSARGLRVLAADGAGSTLLPQVDLTGPHAWVMGNEAWGLEEAVRERCDDVVRVPIHGHAESLNLAMAATVCLYASAGAQRGPS
ncbi:TrmH family RNA methyltransferase [Barrientosiimonas endolithica]|uniref:RNA methyltransferase n=1 Tax=Barrientosiimonas endolithica TaxID=1535208 RepID=A0ABM8HBK9_9MICO|nr:RNA methyltransferase [Barrientosiimonas endolithica]BDZ58349.1 RNA methyltransferase [Barrientosiimonas endolithica]